MKLNSRHETMFDNLSRWISTFIRVLLIALLFVICVALIVGVIKSGADLYLSLGEPLDKLLQKMLLDAVFIIALVEISMIILGYLKDGKVQVRYIVDTVLIIMLNEVVTLFFKGADLDQMIGVSIAVATLAAVRLSVTRFATKSDDL